MTTQQPSNEPATVFDRLLAAYLEPTFTILQKEKFISPMGMVLDNSGQSRFIALAPENESGADMTAYLNTYRKLLKQQLSTYQASLLGYDVKIRNPEYADAIYVEMHGSDGESIKVLVPYKFSDPDKKLTPGPIQRIN